MLFALTGCGLKITRCEEDVTTGTENTTITEPVVSAETDVTENSEKPDDSDEELTPIYDTSAILEAYTSGDTSPLSEKDKAVYDAALLAISEFYVEGMSEVEIVTAAHDWIVTNASYDEGMMLAIPNKSPETENPYGLLILHQGICMGYTTTFQLFMDMLGVQSQIVRGIAAGGGVWEEHAWNIVNISGEYYHVDVTWDDYVPDEEGRPAFHLYMLVPDYVMEPLHSWDRENTPSATAEDLIYYKSHGLYSESIEDTDRIIRDAIANGHRYCEIMTPSTYELSFNGVSFYWTNDFQEYCVTIFWLDN